MSTTIPDNLREAWRVFDSASLAGGGTWWRWRGRLRLEAVSLVVLLALEVAP